VATVVLIYLKFSQHGYELSVVGGSENTARYVGINVKSVTLRTLFLSGAICGIVGFLMVAGSSHTITSTLVGGRGFTAILVAWLGEFSIPLMGVYSFLVAFVSVGSSNAAAWIGYSSTISNVLTGIFFLLIIVSSFFVSFKVHIKLPNFLKRKEVDDIDENKGGAE
jgi:simple sugar transport system permease protein